MRHSNISRAERRGTPLEGWSGADDEVYQVDYNFTLKEVVIDCQRSEELSCHDTITIHLREGDAKIHPLKWQKELLLIQDH